MVIGVWSLVCVEVFGENLMNDVAVFRVFKLRDHRMILGSLC